MKLSGQFLPNGVWYYFNEDTFRASIPRAGLLLDRDGVVVYEVGYLHRPEDVLLHAGAAALIGAANRRALPVAVVTNQPGNWLPKAPLLMP